MVVQDLHCFVSLATSFGRICPALQQLEHLMQWPPEGSMVLYAAQSGALQTAVQLAYDAALQLTHQSMESMPLYLQKTALWMLG